MFNPSMGGGADLSSKPAYSTTYSTNDCKGYTEKPCWGWRDGGWGVGLENTLIPVLYHQHHKYLQEGRKRIFIVIRLGRNEKSK